MITTKLPAPVLRQDRCDRCPATAHLQALMPAGELLFCRHHARVHADGLIAAGARLSFIGPQD
jgi:hypothetical protein